MKQQIVKNQKNIEPTLKNAITTSIETETDHPATAPDTTTECLTISVVKAGVLLGVARGTAYKAVRSGDIPGIKVRNRWVVPLEALHAMLAARSRDPWA